MPERPLAMFAMTAENVPWIFPPEVLARLRACVDIDPGLVAEDFTAPRVREALAGVEILITGWGCPRLDAAVLDAAPELRAVLHAAGSVKGFATPALWERGIAVSSAAGANALPVAEYALAMILLAGKDLFAHRDRFRTDRAFPMGTSCRASATSAAGSGSWAPPASAAGSSNCCAPSTCGRAWPTRT